MTTHCMLLTNCITSMSLNGAQCVILYSIRPANGCLNQVFAVRSPETGDRWHDVRIFQSNIAHAEHCSVFEKKFIVGPSFCKSFISYCLSENFTNVTCAKWMMIYLSDEKVRKKPLLCVDKKKRIKKRNLSEFFFWID